MLHKDNQENKVKMTKEAPEVQLAPVTKEVFVTVLDSMKSPSSAEITSGSKQHFISYVHGMVDKIKDFPKLFKASHKQSKELNITPAVCESLSELLALPDPEKRSTTSLHDSVDRLCTEDEINRASRGVSNILLTPGGSQSQQDVNEIQQPQRSTTSLASARSVHDNARGIVDTIVTDLEDLYESLEPKEVEMIQSQSSLTQTEPTLDDDGTQKKFHNKVYRILCSAQVKLRMLYTMHRSEDIIPDSKTDLATEETGHDGIQLENQSDAERQADVPAQAHEEFILSSADECAGNALGELANEPQVQALTSTEQQDTMEMSDSEACDKSLPCKKDGGVPPPASQLEPKDKKRGKRKGLKIFLPKNNIFKAPRMAPATEQDATSLEESTVDTSIPETVSYTTESELDTMSTSSIASPETATVEVIQHYVTSSQAAPEYEDIYEENETTLTCPDQDEEVEAPIITESSDRQDNSLNLGKKLKNVFVRCPMYPPVATDSLEVVAVSDDKATEPVEPVDQGEECNLFSDIAETEPTSDSTDIDKIVDAFIERSLSPESFTKEDVAQGSPPPDEMTEGVSSGNQHTMGGKLKRLFSKSPKPPVKTLEPLETTQDTVSSSEEKEVETQASDMESFTCEADKQPSESTLPEASPSDDTGEGDAPSVTDITQNVEPSPTSATPETKDKRQSVGKRFITLFARSPKPINVDTPSQADETVLEAVTPLVSEIRDDTPETSAAPETEETLQPPMTTSSETSLQDVPVQITPETKYNRLSVGKKMKTLFTKSPKPVDVEPAMDDEAVTEEAITELPVTLDSEMTDETPDDSCAPDAEATAQSSMQTSDETSLQHDPAKAVPDSKDTRFSVGKKIKTLFTKSPKPIDVGPPLMTDDVLAVPVVSQEVAKECAEVNISPQIVSQTCEAPVQQSVNMSFQETPRREDIFEIDGTVSPSVSQKRPPLSMTGPSPKSVHFSIAEKLKQFFSHPKHSAEDASTVSTELSSEPALPEEFHTISEAVIALKNLTDRMTLHLDDHDTAKEKLDSLVSHGVLRPFSIDLVNRVYRFLSGDGCSTATGIELSRYASEPAIHTVKTVGECKRQLIIEPDSEITQAFAVKSIQALLRQVLEMILPLIEGADTSGCPVLNGVTDFMAKAVASTMSPDHVTDTDVSNRFCCCCCLHTYSIDFFYSLRALGLILHFGSSKELRHV